MSMCKTAHYLHSTYWAFENNHQQVILNSGSTNDTSIDQLKTTIVRNIFPAGFISVCFTTLYLGRQHEFRIASRNKTEVYF